MVAGGMTSLKKRRNDISSARHVDQGMINTLRTIVAIRNVHAIPIAPNCHVNNGPRRRIKVALTAEQIEMTERRPVPRRIESWVYEDIFTAKATMRMQRSGKDCAECSASIHTEMIVRPITM